jgi:cellulose synthase operon protein C
MPAQPRSWSNPNLAAFLERRMASATPAPAPAAGGGAVITAVDAFRQAAAVLASFDPATLRPVGGSAQPGAAYGSLVDDVSAGAAEGGVARWTLKPALRREALATVQRGIGFTAALAANPDRPLSDLQRCLEHYLVGAVYPSVQDRSAEQLAQTLRVVEWLDGLVPGLPSRRDIEARLERARFLAPFTHLLAKGFAGRERELDTLRVYVGVQQASGLVGQSLQLIDLWASTITGNPRRGPLVIWGPGGVGKSTFIARFVTEHAAQLALTPFPFVYLDFDSGSLGITSAAPLLIQICAQLETQSAEQAPRLAALRRRVSRLLAQPAPGSASGAIAIVRERPGRLEHFEQTCLRRLGRLAQQVVRTVSLRGRVMPFLIVLDTFERVHNASEAQVRKIGGYIETLRQGVPSLRVVVSGRNDVRALLRGTEDVEALELTDLDVSAAHAVLLKLGIDAPSERTYIFSLTGGNPLSLHLAAELSRKGTLERGVTAQLKYRAKRLIGETLVQGMLYDRILFNIEDDDVKALAHPGLALRYLTPAIIDEVLAEPCQLALPADPARRRDAVRDLFEALRRYASLVVPDGVGLRHRADVRRVMLASLDHDKPALVRTLDELAVAFHQRHEAENPLLSRAEEVYHRLRLNQSAQEIEPRWLPEVGELVADSLGELSVQSQLYLIDKGVRADLEGFAVPSLGDLEWERLIAAKVPDLLRYNLIDEAETALAERPSRSADSPLWLAEAQIASARADWPAAAAQAETARRAATRTNDPRRLETALMVGAVAAIKLGDLETARRSVERADAVIAASVNRRPGSSVHAEPVLDRRQLWPRLMAWLCPPADGAPTQQPLDAVFRGADPWELQRDRRLADFVEGLRRWPGQTPPPERLASLDFPIFGVNDAVTDDNRAS